MALKVWLPLNGTLDNLGTSNYNITAFRGSVTYNANGKIGQCFHSNGVNTLKINNILPDIYNYTAYSLCAWAYVESNNTSHTGSGIISAGNWNNQLLNLSMSDWSTDHYTKLRISGTNWNRTYNYNFYKNIWYHIVVCDDGVHTYAYVNGILIGDTATSFLPTSIEGTDICIGGATYYAGMQFFGRINDVRIYDHCLSAAEVREISQGLVLHYKLDSFQGGYGNENLILYSSRVISGGSASDIATRTYTDEGLKIESSGTGWIRLVLNQETASSNNIKAKLTAGDTYTISFEIKNETLTSKPSLYINAKNSYRSCNLGTMKTNEWCQIGYTNTWIDPESNGALLLHINNAKGTFWIRNFKLEKNSSITSWCLSDNEQSIDRTKIQDSSGYNHNGTIIGNLSISSDTPRYSASAIFNGTDTKIQVPNITPAELTVSFWMKRGANTGTRQFMYTAWSGVTCELQTNGTPTFAVYRSSYPTITGTAITTSSGWVHYCATFDTINGSKLYQNGILKSSNSNITPIAYNITTNYIGYYNTYYNGLISDFRIYCTALDADAIRQLYELGAKVDNKGNLHTFELNEYSINKLTKTGILKDNIIEPYITLSDGSHWKLLLFHWVDHGNNLFTSTNASYCNDFGLYSRLNEADNYTYNNKYEFYVLQDDIEYRWTQTNKPTAASPSGFTTISGYTNAVQGLVKPTSLTQTYFGYNSWWGACGSWTKYSTGGKTGIPGFGAHSAAGICENYLALYARIDDATFRLAHLSAYANNFIEL